jgi:hypothetical protein
VLPGITTDDIEEIIGWRDYCYEIGISARSIQSMAFYLMRQSLAGYFKVSRGRELPWHRFPTGARMQARSGIYENVIQSDIRAAYLWGIGRLTPASVFSQSGRRLHPETIAETPGAFALVKYRYPFTASWGSVPDFSDNGTTIFPEIKSDWGDPILLSSSDIYCGLAAGARFRILKSWLPAYAPTEPFSSFMHEVYKLREKFPNIAKQAGNTLWGSFCASSELSLVRFNAGTGHHKATKIPARTMLAAPIGYTVISALRSRLFMEGIGGTTIHAHTDGIISPRPVPFLDPNTIGGWRIAGRYRLVEILSPSWYRLIGENGEESYRMAGRADSGRTAARIFAHNRDKVLSEEQKSGFLRELEDATDTTRNGRYRHGA